MTAQSAQQPVVVTRTHHESQMMVRSGPLPEPDDFREYEDICPGAAKAILAMAVDQASHRRDLESRVVSANIARESRGQWLAASAFGIVAGAGFYTMAAGHLWAGGVVIFVDLASIVTVFITGRVTQSKELAKKKGPEPKEA